MTVTAFPIVHNGGTSRDALLEGYVDAANAVQHAYDVLVRNGPNARDYRPAGHTAFITALAEHNARLMKLREVQTELEVLGGHVAGLS